MQAPIFTFSGKLLPVRHPYSTAPKPYFWPIDKEAIGSLIMTIASIQPARILLTSQAIEAAEIIPASDGVLYDYFLEL
jgi:hypothetical protein